jgi:hypothetical protein
MSTKLLEQEWTYRMLDGDVVDATGFQLTADDVADETLRFIAAAPDMARSLVKLLDVHALDWRTSGAMCEGCETAIAALRKAGVL